MVNLKLLFIVMRGKYSLETEESIVSPNIYYSQHTKLDADEYKQKARTKREIR